MATWRCSSCGATKESRCKPKKCSSCGQADSMIKMEGDEGTSTCKSKGKRSCKG